MPFHCAQHKLMQLFCDTTRADLCRARGRLWVCPFGFGDCFFPQIKSYLPFPFLPAGTHIQNLLAGADPRWYRAATQGNTGSLW